MAYETPRKKSSFKDFKDLQGRKIEPPVPTDFSDSEETNKFYSFPELGTQNPDRLTDQVWVYRLVEVIEGVNTMLFTINLVY